MLYQCWECMDYLPFIREELRGKPSASRGNAVAPIYFGYHDIRDAQSEKGIYHTYLLQEITLVYTIHALDFDLGCAE